MKVVYMSYTGQTRKFIEKLDIANIEINMNDYGFEVNEPYLLIVPTYDKEATFFIDEFIEFNSNLKNLRGVCGSGNRNFNEMFCFTAKDISLKYGVPLVHCFEFRGSDYDVSLVKEWVNKNGES